MRTDPSAFDALSNFLIERGSPGVVIKKDQVQAYFALTSDPAPIKNDIQRFLRGIGKICSKGGTPRLRWRVLKDRNWNSSWRRFFSPQKIGKAFWVTPPWISPPSSPHRHVITIEPGMAFGTGTHATTRGCLEFIEKVARALPGFGFSALDVGTGSGILAISLAKLGAKKVWALDNDPVALKVARENMRCNAVQNKVHLCATNLRSLRRLFAVVVANLTAETILDLADALDHRVAPKGFLILSGILKTKARDVLRCFSSSGFRLVKRKEEKEWATLLLRRK